MGTRVAKGKAKEFHWLASGGETGAVIRSLDWSKTPLGPVAGWPQSLRTAVNLCLVSNFPAAVIWGDERSQVYNDAYRVFCGDQHPQALGQDFKTCRSSEWSTLATLIEDAKAGRSRMIGDQRVFLPRDDYLEETFFTFSFTPIYDESGAVSGLFHSASETTQQSLTERRAKLLRELAAHTAEVKTVQDVFRVLTNSLAKAQTDLPFFLLYLREAGETQARLVVNVGLEKGLPITAEVLDLAKPTASGWPVVEPAQNCQTVQVNDLAQRFGLLSCGSYLEAPRQAVILPVPAAGMARPMGLIIAGVSARRSLDELCRTFYQQLNEGVTNLLTSARAYTEEWRRREATAALQQTEERYRAIVESQTELLSRFQPDGTILFVNNAAARAVGTTTDALVGLNVWTFVSDEHRAAVEGRLKRLSPGDPQFRIEYPLQTPEGERWILWTVCALGFDPEGRPGEYQSCGVDITQRKRAEEKLRESEEQLRLALQGANAGAWSLDLKSGATFWSEEFLALYDYAPDSPRTYTFWIGSVHPDDRERIKAAFWERIESPSTSYRQEFRISHPQKGRRWILDMGRIKRDAQGNALRIDGINMDITERKQAEEVLRESEDKFRRLAEAVPTLVWTSREDGFITYVNPRWIEYTGQTLDQAWGFGWFDVIHPVDLPPARAFWEHCLATGELYEGEIRYRRYDGEYRWHHFKVLPSLDSEGKISGWYGASLDIHAMKKAEQALRNSEALFRNIADTAPAMLWTTNPDGSCSFLSQGWYEYTGQKREEAKGFGWFNAVHPADRKTSARTFRKASSRRKKFAFDFRVRRADGQYRWAIDAGRPRFGIDGEFQGYIGSVIDVHKRKQAEETLRESEERFHTLADNMSQFAWMADPGGRIFWFNQRWREYTGTDMEDMKGWGWTKALHPDHVDRVVERIRSRDTPEPWEDLFPLRNKEGTYRWFLSRALPIRDQKGQVIRWLGTNTDINEQRTAEEALKEADRRKNEFLATLAHELRNPLAPLRNGLEIIHLASDDPASVEKARRMMERQFEHMVRLIDDLLDLSRISRGKITLHRKRIQVATAVQQAVETSRPVIDELEHKLTVSLPAEPVCVNADPTRLSQVFSNLLNNAAKFTDPGGSVWLTVERRNGEVVVSVRDNGIGIPPPVLPRVFDMFTQADPTLERTHGGLGIGLSLVKGLVEMHGGSVEARSDGVNLGSEFIVRLPAVSPTAAEEAAQTERVDSHQRRRILVVDDNRDSANSMATMLELMGNETKTAHDGLEALGVAAAFRPDVMLLDIGMPKLNGYDVARKIREEEWGQGMVLVALTGWGQEEDRRRSEEAGLDFHLVKPVELAALQKVLGADSRSAGKKGG